MDENVSPTTKVCRECGIERPIECFWKKKEMAGGRVHHCNTCLGKRKSEYRRVHRDVYRERNREWARNLRREVLAAYGHRCACCGETTAEFLALDHKNNDGAEHRRTVGEGTKIYMDVKRRRFPPEFQLLCHNCNQAKGYYGYCPHQRLQDDSTQSPIPEVHQGITGQSQIIQ